MLGRLAQNWWVLVLRGIVGVLFGILAFAYPRDTVAALVILLGAYMLVDGVTALVMAFHVDRGSGWLVLSGSAGIAAGLLTFFYPVVTAYALLYIIAAWAIISGVFEIVAAIEFRRALSDVWLLGLAGTLSIALGILLAAAPGTGLISLIWLLGGYALVFASCTSSPASASRVCSRRSVRHAASAAWPKYAKDRLRADFAGTCWEWRE